MRKTNICGLFFVMLAAMGLASACVSAEKKNEQRRTNQPEEIVKLVCIDRLRDYDAFSDSEKRLGDYKVYFTKSLQQQLTKRAAEYVALSSEFKNYQIPKLGGYLMLSQGDAVTQCQQPLIEPQTQQIETSGTERIYKVIYGYYGADRLQHKFHVTVHLVPSKNGWVISEVEYGEPVYIFGDRSTKPIRTLSEMLSVMIKELNDAKIWTEKHRNELVPFGEIHVGRGPFDRP